MNTSKQQIYKLCWDLIKSISSKDLGLIFVKSIRVMDAIAPKGHVCTYFNENNVIYTHNTNKLTPAISYCSYRVLKLIISEKNSQAIPLLEEIAVIIGINPTTFLHLNLDDATLTEKIILEVENERNR